MYTMLRSTVFFCKMITWLGPQCDNDVIKYRLWRSVISVTRFVIFFFILRPVKSLKTTCILRVTPWRQIRLVSTNVAGRDTPWQDHINSGSMCKTLLKFHFTYTFTSLSTFLYMYLSSLEIVKYGHVKQQKWQSEPCLTIYKLASAFQQMARLPFDLCLFLFDFTCIT